MDTAYRLAGGGDMSRIPEPVVKVMEGKEIARYLSMAEAAEKNFYTTPAIFTIINKGTKARDGATYMLAKDWDTMQQVGNSCPKQLINRKDGGLELICGQVPAGSSSAR